MMEDRRWVAADETAFRHLIRTGCGQARPGTEPFVPIVSIHRPFAEHMLPRVIS
jgi:hypothetical protein